MAQIEFKLRTYQQRASDSAVFALKNNKNNGLIILPTGSGKSLVIADIASRIKAPLLILQPSKEILEQNYTKYITYSNHYASIYSASVGQKNISRVTFATIGSVINHLDFFRHFHYVIIDEAHTVKPEEGMYKRFIEHSNRVVLGLTATPYRLYSDRFGGSQLKFITRTRPRIFKDVLFYVQVSELLKEGFLSKMRYFDMTTLEMKNVKSNSTGADYNDESLLNEYNRSGFYKYLIEIVKRLLSPKNGSSRRGILVFTRFVKEAEMLASYFNNAAVVSADTPKRERENIIEKFKSGQIKIVANAACLTTGFDYPELDTIVMARPTKSLGLWYQIVGRAIRPYSKKKESWIVDLCGNYKRFGAVENLRITEMGKNKWCVMSGSRQLTNTYL